LIKENRKSTPGPTKGNSGKTKKNHWITTIAGGPPEKLFLSDKSKRTRGEAGKEKKTCSTERKEYRIGKK